ncbi:sulfite exporter TauE/SafE family protein [Staphylococcus gallinarum]|uniref:sulfite exporter TauE/SafE family protein n=1 Tax=Staphylococcus gallinarum TaxID=1293 RepID=UPI000D1D0373|nr:sulfite exporter TauE/SafE family protein [Staphylococcus gallinarum]MBU7216578.1 sulfite exporter TauE/SafE family protein [Staphylococcus gallinarum]MCD8917340.1 sulfite exporter TauE/SafE family protein [Staphylococcus gallinarum]PTE37918.1 sulfite exporter TauE/SafE family protein [Staphylococcus gallinarum]PTK96490.1 sulfite exporter TauE/SafE family protein [Staphylococcus gallinarum]PTK96850.1 sulfite exporter TauE/SafE family protein [Staphylococcus gallinarum]
MHKLFIFALAGFLAQLIDGSLGMGFGASSSSILLTFGVAPAIASATIHFSEIATTAASGTSHLKFENVHKPTLIKLAIPGAITAFIGAAFLSNIHSDLIKPFIAVFLLSMGLYILYQFLFKRNQQLSDEINPDKGSRFSMIPQGLVAGFLDAVGGGGWGPVNTPLLLASKKLEPRYAIGTVSASEFFVTISASLGFIVFLGWDQINWALVISLSVGGMLAAPIAAWFVKILPMNILAVCVSGLIIFTNSSSLLSVFNPGTTVALTIKIALIVVWIGLVIFALSQNKKLPFSVSKKKANVNELD